jgi:cytochrome c-type biogenesis protein CcmE
MKPRSKFLAGGALIIGAAGFLMVSAISDTGMFWLTPTELLAKVATDSTFRGAGVKVGAKVLPGSIVRSENGKQVSFIATDGGTQFPVRYNRIPPDTFTDDADVILTGRLQPDGSFLATELLAKCASRFEAEPDSANLKYRDTPGYKAAQKDTL